MFRPFLPILGTAALLLVSTWHTQAAPSRSTSQNSTAPRVWTNADIDQLKTVDLPALPAQNPSPNAAGTRLYTNADTDRLHNEDLISTFVLGPAEQAEANEALAPLEAAAQAPGPPPPKFQDPDWYAKQALKLNTQLALDEVNLDRARRALSDVKNRTTQPGIDLFEGDVGITPEGGIENLRARVRDDEILLNQLGDLARQNGIEPGVLRNY